MVSALWVESLTHPPYRVKTPEFEGPIELLLNLIEEKKLAVSEVSLTEVADGFIRHLETLTTIPLAEVAGFIYVASILILTKSHSLLPTLPLTIAEEASIHELEARLNHYRKIRELGVFFSERFDRRVISGRNYEGYPEPLFSPGSMLTGESLSMALRSLLGTLGKPETSPREAVIENIISLKELIERLTDRVKEHAVLSFREATAIGEGGKLGREQKLNIIVHLLAVLELVKQGVVTVTQGREFEDISIHRHES